jgi:hypothetical protein
VGASVSGFVDPGHRRSCTILRHVPDGARALRLVVVARDHLQRPLPDAAVRAGTRATAQRSAAAPTRELALDVRGTDLWIDLGAPAREGDRVCVRQRRGVAPFSVSLRGTGSDPLAADAAFGVIYESGRDRTWLSRAGDLVSHVAAARPASQGGWTAVVGLALIALAGIGAILVAWAAAAGRLGHGRRALACVAAVAVASSASWAFIMPPLQTPDSEAHLSFVSYIAHHGGPVEDGDASLSSALSATQAFTREQQVRFVRFARPPWSAAQAGARPSSTLRDDDGGVVANAQGNPILYYAAMAVPYRVAGAGPFGGELWIRLLSALLFGVTAVGVVLFLRELLPGTPRLAAIGGLLVALLPQAAFVSGSVNPDALLFALSSLALWRVARAFRHGLDVRGGLVLGGLLAAAALSKLAGLMLMPGVGIALLALLWRARRTSSVRAALFGAIAVAVGLAVPFLLYQGLAAVFWEQGTTGAGQASSLGQGNLRQELSYVWQFFLPRLPSMDAMFDGSPLQEVYAKGMIGNFGWSDVAFPDWTYDLGRTVLWVGAALGVAFLVRGRAAVRARAAELLTYLAMLVAVLVLVAHLGYRYRLDLGIGPGGGGFEQTRYLFPLLALYGAMGVAAIRLAGRRLAGPVGIVVVSLAALHATAGLLLAFARYYG